MAVAHTQAATPEQSASLRAQPQTAASPATQAHCRSATRPDDDARASGRDGLNDCAVAQDSKGRVAGILGEEATNHSSLGHLARACGGTRARQSGHSAPYAGLAPRPERCTRALVARGAPTPRRRGPRVAG
eukprot:7980421-Alexandrium_andersonii.AAC.1